MKTINKRNIKPTYKCTNVSILLLIALSISSPARDMSNYKNSWVRKIKLKKLKGQQVLYNVMHHLLLLYTLLIETLRDYIFHQCLLFQYSKKNVVCTT